MKELIDEELKKIHSVPGINYLEIEQENDNVILCEIYYKDEKEYKLVGMWNSKKNSKLPEYSQVIYEELKNQGLTEVGCKFIALDVRNEEESKRLMEYLISVREKNISYTELWEKKNKIINYDNNSVVGNIKIEE